MSDQQDEAADKPHEASTRKLEDARKKGEIVRSQDTITLVVFALFIALVSVLFGTFMTTITTKINVFIESAIVFPDNYIGARASYAVFEWVMPIAVLLFIIPFAILISGLIALRQMIFTTSKLELKLNRISLVANAKKKFGVAGLFEFGKTVLKFFVFSALFIFFLFQSSQFFDDIVMLIPNHVNARLYSESMRWFILATLTYAMFAVIDIIWQTREHAKKNRMSHKEVKDEQKNEEGDEMIRQQRRAKAEEIATNRMLLDVPKASVVITNPTHYAVALKWTGGNKSVPHCVARGKDETARRIRETAIQSGVAIYRDPPTARDLYANVKVGQPIERDHYKAVAVAIGYAQRIQKMAAEYEN